MNSPSATVGHSKLKLTDTSHINEAGVGLSGTLYRSRPPQLSAVAYKGECHGCGGLAEPGDVDAVQWFVPGPADRRDRQQESEPPEIADFGFHERRFIIELKRIP